MGVDDAVTVSESRKRLLWDFFKSMTDELPLIRFCKLDGPLPLPLPVPVSDPVSKGLSDTLREEVLVSDECLISDEIGSRTPILESTQLLFILNPCVLASTFGLFWGNLNREGFICV